MIVSVTLLCFVLISGQPHITIAGTSSGEQISLNGLSRSETFDVEVSWVGSTTLAADELTLDADGTYHLISDQFIPKVALLVNISGWTCFDCSSVGDTIPANDKRVLGTFYIIVNGQVQLASTNYLSSIPVTLAIQRGDNSISFVYVGNGAEGLKWASDTVIVRVGESEAELDDGFDTKQIPVAFGVTDAAVAAVAANAEINTTIITQNWNTAEAISKKIADGPPMDLNFTMVSGTTSRVIQDGNSADLGDDLDGYSLMVNGTIDSRGLDGEQSRGTNMTSIWWDLFATDKHYDRSQTIWDATVGHTFFLDSAGLRWVNVSTLPTDFDAAAFNATVFSSNSGDQITSHVGMLVLSDYGYWDVEQDANRFPNTPGVYTVGPDWEALHLAAGPGDFDWSSVDYYWGSFDFKSTVASASFVTEGAEVPNTITNTDVETRTTTQTTETGGLPGFGALVSLITVGAIAYVAPRMRKQDE